MELTEQMMACVVSSVSGTGEQRQHEQRKANRVSVATCLSFAIVRDGVIGNLTTVLVQNLSRTGLSFLGSTELLVGQDFVVWLPIVEERWEAVFCKVAWRELLTRTSLVIGGYFTRMGNEEESALHARARTCAPTPCSTGQESEPSAGSTPAVSAGRGMQPPAPQSG
jgi:hypothetical protein